MMKNGNGDNMRYIKRGILYLVCFPSDILAWLIILFLRMMWGNRLYWEKGVLVTTFKAESWPVRTWYKNWGGTTFGHAILLSPFASPTTFSHELVHVEQCEVTALFSILWVIVFLTHNTNLHNLITAICLMCLNTLIYALLAMLTAFLRGESAYRGSVQEEAAYSITKESNG